MFHWARRLIGHDVFVSYSRDDAKGYPDALVAALPAGISVDSDKFDTEPGASTPKRVLRRIGRAKLFVVIASPGGAASSCIAEEIGTFLKTRRNMLVVDVAQTVERCQWRGLVEGLPTEDETKENVDRAEVSPLVVRRIVNMVGYFTRARRLEWSAAAATIVFVASLFGLLVVRSTAVEAGLDARLAQMDREAATVEADRQRQEADRQRKAAEEQSVLASAQRIANAATQLWNDRSVSLDTVLLLSAESLRRRHTGEALAVMNAALPLRSARSGPLLPVARKQGISVSPDGRWVGTFDYSILEAKTGRTIWREPKCSLLDTPFFGDRFASAICRREKTIIHLFDGPNLTRHRTFDDPDPPDNVFFSTSAFYFGRKFGPKGAVQVRRRADNALIEMWPASDVAAAGDVLAIATDPQHVELRDASTLQPIGKKLAFSGPITGLAMSEDGLTLAVAWWKPGDLSVPNGGLQFNGQVSIYCLSPVAVRTGQMTFGQMVSQLALSRDGSALAVLTGASVFDPTFSIVTLYEPPPYRRWSRSISTSRLFSPLRFVGDDVMFVDSRVVRIADRETGFDRATIVGEGGIDDVATSGESIVILGPTGATSWRLPRSSAHPRRERVATLTDGGRVVVFRDDRGIRVTSRRPPRDLLRVGSPTVTDEFGGFDDAAFVLRNRKGRRLDPVSADGAGRFVAIASPSAVHIYDTATGNRLPDRTYVDSGRAPSAMQMSVSGEYLVTAFSHDAETIRLTAVPSGRQIDRFEIPLSKWELPSDTVTASIAVSAGGDWIVGTNTRAGAWIRNVARRMTTGLGRICPQVPCIAAISPAGDTVALGGGGKIVLLSPAHPSARSELDVLLPVAGLAFSADGTTLAIIAAGESQSRLMVVKTKDKSSPLFFELPYVPAGVTFAADAEQLAIVDSNGIVYDVPLNAKTAATAICAQVGRSLTRDEWNRYIREPQYVDTCKAPAISVTSTR